MTHKYKSIPIDEETHKRVMTLCQAYEMGERGQGALVRKLVNAEYNKLAAVKLLPVPVENVKVNRPA